MKINTYTIYDVESNVTESKYNDLDELRVFANELFWDEEDVDFENADFETVYKAIRGCGYDLIEE